MSAALVSVSSINFDRADSPPRLNPTHHVNHLDHLEHLEYEAKIDSFGDLASQFVCAVYQCRNHVSGHHDFRNHALDTFVIHILRQMKLHDDVLFGALMFIQRVRFRSPEFFFNKNHPHRIFISAYILSAKELAREDGAIPSSLEDYSEWSTATRGLFDEIMIQKMERATLKILREDKVKGIQADTAFDGLLPKFRRHVVWDYEDRWEFPPYPQSMATVRPVFVIPRGG